MNGKKDGNELQVDRGDVKLRLLNSGSPVPFIVSVDNHTFSVVAMDGKVDLFVLWFLFCSNFEYRMWFRPR